MCCTEPPALENWTFESGPGTTIVSALAAGTAAAESCVTSRAGRTVTGGGAGTGVPGEMVAGEVGALSGAAAGVAGVRPRAVGNSLGVRRITAITRSSATIVRLSIAGDESQGTGSNPPGWNG